MTVKTTSCKSNRLRVRLVTSKKTDLENMSTNISIEMSNPSNSRFKRGKYKNTWKKTAFQKYKETENRNLFWKMTF
jgi:hypothetical protein